MHQSEEDSKIIFAETAMQLDSNHYFSRENFVHLNNKKLRL